MRIAIEGCCHGELERVYASVMYIQQQKKIKIDLLLICGDFQAIRNLTDLSVLACPEKYRTIGSFYKYYSGEKKAPVPTVFIGGNHEASNYLWELFHGGWVCHNIYFLGFAGAINFGGLRIAGISGIYKKHDYENGYYEQQPFNDSHARSIYHVRKFNVYRLAQIRQKVDVFLSHDWPRGIALYGNVRKLILAKPLLAGEINTYTLGSYPNEHLLKLIKPRFWFSAHLHVKHAAIYNHGPGPIHRAMNLPFGTNNTPKENLNQEVTSSVKDAEQNVEEAGDVEPADTSNTMKDSPCNVKSLSEGLNSQKETNSVTSKLNTDKLSNEGSDSTHQGNSESSTNKHDPCIDTPSPVAKNAEICNKIQEPQALKEGSESNDHGLQSKPQKNLKKTQDIPNVTRFLALDKCLPGRDFLQVMDIDVDPVQNSEDGEYHFYYDKEWLSIVRATCNLISFTKQRTQMPPDSEIKKVLENEIKWVNDNISQSAMRIPDNFVMTAPVYSPDNTDSDNSIKSKQIYFNPQTQHFCDLLQIKNFINPDGVAINWDGGVKQPMEKIADFSEMQDLSYETQMKFTSDQTA